MSTPIRIHSNASGLSRLGVLIFLLIIASTVFVGYQVFPFYYYYYEIEGLMQSQADKASVFTDDEIRRTILERVQKLELPLEDPEELKINRFDGKIVIEMEYQEVLFVDFGEKTYDLHVFNFHPRVEQPITGRR